MTRNAKHVIYVEIHIGPRVYQLTTHSRAMAGMWIVDTLRKFGGLLIGYGDTHSIKYHETTAP